MGNREHDTRFNHADGGQRRSNYQNRKRTRENINKFSLLFFLSLSFFLVFFNGLSFSFFLLFFAIELNVFKESGCLLWPAHSLLLLTPLSSDCNCARTHTKYMKWRRVIKWSMGDQFDQQLQHTRTPCNQRNWGRLTNGWLVNGSIYCFQIHTMRAEIKK